MKNLLKDIIINTFLIIILIVNILIYFEIKNNDNDHFNQTINSEIDFNEKTFLDFETSDINGNICYVHICTIKKIPNPYLIENKIRGMILESNISKGNQKNKDTLLYHITNSILEYNPITVIISTK